MNEREEALKKQSTIGHRLKKSIENRDLTYITKQMYAKNFELAQTNKTLSLLRAIDEVALEPSGSLNELSQDLAEVISKKAGLSMVALFVKSGERDESIRLTGFSAGDKKLPQPMLDALPSWRISTKHDWLNHVGKAESFKVVTNKQNKLTGILGAHQEDFEGLCRLTNIEEVFFVKVFARLRLVGVLMVGFQAHVGADHSQDHALMERLSEALGIGIYSRMLLEENKHVLARLEQSNEKLKQLDEAKDEFISMASHQLRTPLTSVKGYVSMVLEGDAGAVKPMQKQLLDQAFVSSQRMVYLIADLLNVSRLRTGKFIIEATPSYLPDVIEGELSQLTETAKSRNLELIYDKPKHFPTLMLDETKTRQVIMNFVDNAIYYTPSGGHIHVNLKESDEAVEFTVVDDGLGVPKQEQHHLFSKFYRANNAKKARPDGTGLGLFMAKKVVVAQGGAIIFKSEEGKGSTFGFTFAKSKLLAKKGAVKPAEKQAAKL